MLQQTSDAPETILQVLMCLFEPSAHTFQVATEHQCCIISGGSRFLRSLIDTDLTLIVPTSANGERFLFLVLRIVTVAAHRGSDTTTRTTCSGVAGCGSFVPAELENDFCLYSA